MRFIKASLAALIFLAAQTAHLQAQSISVTGKIVDSKGNPVSSASVRIKDSKQGTSSDSNGVFHIKAKPDETLLLSAIGFADTSLAIGGRLEMSIVLRPQPRNLREVVVAGINQNSGLPSPEEATREQIITNTFDSYLRGAEFSNGVYVISSYGAGGPSRVQLTGFGALNTITSGVMLPVIEHKEETRGSRYLLNRFAKGLIVDHQDHVINDPGMLLNYDKIDGQLMIAKDGKNYLEVDKEKVAAFALKTEDSSYVFLNVPILSKENYFLLIANGTKYSAYKSVRTKFVKSNYTSNGLVETGNNYDEYVDKQTYYWVDQKNEKAGIFELKKKSIKEAFASEAAKVDAYFSLHKHEDVDENFVKNLISYLNR